MRRTILPALLACTMTGAAIAQVAPMPAASDRAWSVSAEALLSWFKQSPTPVPIITDNYVGAPGVNVLLGGGSVDTRPNAGVKIGGTYRADSQLGIELSGFYIPKRSTSGSVNSSGEPGSVDLYLPYYDVTIGQENVTEISHWPDYRGSAQATLSNDLGGGEVNVTWTVPSSNAWRLDLLGGLRLMQLHEGYTIATSSPYNPPNPVDIWNTIDTFDARNRFYGLQAGARATYDQGAWVGSVTGKLALGSMQQRVSISGSLETNDYNDYGAPQTFSGGYFALPSNGGTHMRNTFAVVPEIALSMGYRLASQATLFASYSFLYASNVVRPGDQINRNINPTQSVAWGNDPPIRPTGPAQPTFDFNTSSFWAQSLAIGIAFRF